MKLHITIVACFAWFSAGAAFAAPATLPASRPADRVRLEVQLPKIGFDGEWMRFDRWKRQNPKAEDCALTLAPFLLPKGAVNLALHKPVTSSDNDPHIGALDQITDGDKEGGEGSYVEIGPGLQWIQIDLGRPCTLYAVLVWHNAAWPGLHKDVIVQLSDDPRFREGVRTIFNNDSDNSSKLGRGTDREFFEAIGTKVIDAKGIVARYVRLYSNGRMQHDCSTYVEVEVHGLRPEHARLSP